MIARHVKSKSAEVIGVPSAHTALSAILKLTVNGFWVMPPLSSVGASASTGDATKFPFRSSTIAYGSTCSATEYQNHVADEQLVIGLMHSGHCSAPRTISPPCWMPCVVVADPAGLLAFGLPLPPQAAATMPTTESIAMARTK